MLLQEGDVRQLFSPFGTISSIEIMKDMSGQSQGYGYVEFTSMPDASKAMQQWDGMEVVGQKLSVKVATMGPGQGGAVALPQLDLDDDEGMAFRLVHCLCDLLCFCWLCCMQNPVLKCMLHLHTTSSHLASAAGRR